MTLSKTALCIACHYAQCHDLFILILNVVMLSVIMLSVILPNVFMLSVIMRSVIDVEHSNKECNTEDNVTQHKDIRYNNTRHISFYMLNVLYAEFHLCWRS